MTMYLIPSSNKPTITAIYCILLVIINIYITYYYKI